MKEFLKKPKDKQREELGEVVYYKIQKILGPKGTNIPQITGMLIDLDVFEVADILKFSEKEDLLREKVKEAQEILENDSDEEKQNKPDPSKQIKENLENFLKKPKEEQENELFDLVYPKLMEKLPEKDKAQGKKITKMLTAFSTHSVQAILDLVDNDEKFSNEIQQALAILNDSSSDDDPDTKPPKKEAK